MPEEPTKNELQEQKSVAERLFQLDAYMQQVKGANIMQKTRIAEQAATLSASILAQIAIEQARQAVEIDRLYAYVDGTASNYE